MNQCFCNRLYRMCAPTTTAEYAFSGSLCCIREFQTVDGSHYCLTVFSLSDYKYLHFPHDEYKWLICKLYALISTSTMKSDASNSDVLTIKQVPFDSDFKIKFGNDSLTIVPVTAFGLVKTIPFADVDVFSVCKDQITCDDKWDICTCQTCPVFRRMCDFEASAREKFVHRKPVNVLLITPAAE